jgi:hypothetical protein
MVPQVEHLPIFNGRKISTLLKDGEWYIAIKPICESLEVDYITQFKKAKEDEILGQLLSEHTMVAGDGRMRKMSCLPERYVYGWLFSIRSESEKLLEYKRVCYDLLYNHFHGALTGRGQIIAERSAIDIEIESLQKKLIESPDYQRMEELKNKKSMLGKELNKQVKTYDLNLTSVQGTLFPVTEN